MAGPREDRYKLLRATGVNTSPIVGLYDDAAGVGGPVLDALTARRADLDVIDDDGPSIDCGRWRRTATMPRPWRRCWPWRRPAR